MTPPAPGRGSTTTCWPSTSVIFGPNSHATRSGPGPTTTRMKRVGYSCAEAAVLTTHASARTRARRLRSGMGGSLWLRSSKSAATGLGLIELTLRRGDVKLIEVAAAEAAFVRPIGGQRMAFEHRSARREHHDYRPRTA